MNPKEKDYEYHIEGFGQHKQSEERCLLAWSARKMSKYEVFSGPYFPVFSPNTNLKTCVFGHFSRSVGLSVPSLCWILKSRKTNLFPGYCLRESCLCFKKQYQKICMQDLMRILCTQYA